MDKLFLFKLLGVCLIVFVWGVFISERVFPKGDYNYILFRILGVVVCITIFGVLYDGIFKRKKKL